jgi:two-component system OmpR family sensor kinase
MEEVIDVAGRLGANELDQRIPVRADTPQEVSQLVAALNEMLGRIERSVYGLRRFTADASHELRTPLAALMSQIEVALRRPREASELVATLESALEQLGQVARLVDALLTLARSDAGELPLEPTRVDVAALLTRTLEPYQEIAEERGIALAAEAKPGLLVHADPLWLGRALANLVDNACKYTPPGGRVMLRAEEEDGRVSIVVEDSGPGMSAEERERAFERFYRGEANRGSIEGFGLGLPLAQEITLALGGRLVLAARGETGTIARLSLASAKQPDLSTATARS